MWDPSVADAGRSSDDARFKVKRRRLKDGAKIQLGGKAVAAATGRCGFAGSSRLSLSMHMTQVHRPRKLAVRTRSKCQEAKLYHRLRLSNSAQRQEMLKRLSEVQRLSLERWILVHSEKDAQDPKTARFRERKLCTTRRQRKLAGLMPRGRGHFVSTCCSGHFQLFARRAADVQTARQQYRLLQEVRCGVAQKCRGSRPDEGQAFAETVQSRAEELRRVGFSFTVRVPAKNLFCRYWIGRELRSPRYNLERLPAGLEAFRRLQLARARVHRGHANRYSIFAHNSPAEMEAAWLHLREEYLDVWAEAGWSRQELHVRLQRLEALKRRGIRGAIAE